MGRPRDRGHDENREERAGERRQPKSSRRRRRPASPAPRGRDDPSRAATPVEAPPECPGCRPVRLTRDGVEDFEGRLEYREAGSETAWVVVEPTTAAHERPTRRPGRLAERIAAVRGSPIESCGSMDLVLLDERGKWRRLMQADETLYLHPDRAHHPEVRSALLEVQGIFPPNDRSKNSDAQNSGE